MVVVVCGRRNYGKWDLWGGVGAGGECDVEALGGDQVSIVLPATAMASDAAGQLGLVDPGVQEVIIQPVVTRI